MKEYDHKKIEKKWQTFWERKKVFQAQNEKNNQSSKKKFYNLIEFPYPSGAGMHVGHIRSNTAMDIISRKRRMEGYNVLFPIGWDAFGLPTENYAIKTGVHPIKVTKQNTDTFRRQLKALGFSFDWSREVNTTDPKYYKWTQWIFLQFFKKGLAYKKKTEINWCPQDKIGLANEEVVAGNCERCGTPVEKREKEQWMLAITKYADRLDKDLDTVDYLEKIKIQQRNWIGKSEGAKIKFAGENDSIEIFTTRPETIFGATFVAISGSADKFTGKYVTNPATKEKIPVWEAEYVMKDVGSGAIMGVPAHDERDFEFARKHNLPIKQVVMPDNIDPRNPPQEGKENTRRDVVHVILRDPKKKEVLIMFLKGEKWKGNEPINFIIGGIEEGESRKDSAIREIKEETGYTNVKFVKEIPFETQAKFFAAHKDVNRVVHVHTLVFDLMGSEKVEIEEDEYFTKNSHEFKWIPYEKVEDILNIPDDKASWNYFLNDGYAFNGRGVLINSDKFNGMDSEQARKEIAEFVGGKMVTTYKLRDWIFSRQRYWGEPIPLINCGDCGFVPVPEKDLPVVLPKVAKYKPTDNGESPLADIKSWVNVKCPKCKGSAKRETDTMPNWAGSSWYYLRYTDSKNNKKFAGHRPLIYWTPVDWYNGGMEHTTLHLLYSRFWHKFLFDQGLVPTSEPYKKRTSHGMILAEQGEKMSKSKGNTVNPDDLVKIYGADTLRMYEMFMGPFDQSVSWNTDSMIGPRRFLERVWKLQYKIVKSKTGHENSIQKLIKKVGDDIETMKFNTAISSMMIFTTEIEKLDSIPKDTFETFLKLLSPFAPHITEELWQIVGHKKSINFEKWPVYDISKIESEEVTIIVQVNGKMRGQFKAGRDISEADAINKAEKLPEIQKWIEGKKKKLIFIPGKVINIVI